MERKNVLSPSLYTQTRTQTHTHPDDWLGMMHPPTSSEKLRCDSSAETQVATEPAAEKASLLLENGAALRLQARAPGFSRLCPLRRVGHGQQRLPRPREGAGGKCRPAAFRRPRPESTRRPRLRQAAEEREAENQEARARPGRVPAQAHC